MQSAPSFDLFYNKTFTDRVFMPATLRHADYAGIILCPVGIGIGRPYSIARTKDLALIPPVWRGEGVLNGGIMVIPVLHDLMRSPDYG